MARPRRIAARRSATLVALVALTLAVRLWAMAGQGLWADEFFSLAMATGHSVEHLPQMAEPALGDFVEPSTPLAATEIARYLEHDDPPAGLGRVARAVRLSDTSPPLYYVLLNLWTRVWGTSGEALRALSLLASLAALPILAALARRLGGRRAVVPALLLYALAPLSVHFSTEGRMYSLLWTIASGQIFVSLRLRRRRAARWPAWCAWSALAAAGLLTHYFYVFVLAATTAWLLVQARRVRVRRLAAALALVAALVARWYLELPATVLQWRVTAGWLDGRPSLEELLRATLILIASPISASGPWGWAQAREPLLLALFALLASGLIPRSRKRARWVGGLWLSAACLGPVAVDLLQDAHTSLYLRYALAGLPAAILLAGAALAVLPGAVRAGFLLAVTVLWLPALREITTSGWRALEPYRQIARELDRRLDASSLIVLRSTPASAAGLARYLTGPAPILPLTQAPWSSSRSYDGSLSELESAARGRSRVALVEIHAGNDSGRTEEWLLGRSRQCRQWFHPSGGARVHFCRLRR